MVAHARAVHMRSYAVYVYIAVQLSIEKYDCGAEFGMQRQSGTTATTPIQAKRGGRLQMRAAVLKRRLRNLVVKSISEKYRGLKYTVWRKHRTASMSTTGA